MRLRFILRDLFWLTLLIAMGLGWWLDHREQKRHVNSYSVLADRSNRTKNVISAVPSHPSWASNPLIKKHLLMFGGARASGRDSGKNDYVYESHRDFLFDVETANLRAEVLSMLMTIYSASDIFLGPQETSVSDTEAIISSTEGWLRLRARWRHNDPRIIESDGDARRAIRVLRVDHQLCFYPRYDAAKKPDIRRLPWESESDGD